MLISFVQDMVMGCGQSPKLGLTAKIYVWRASTATPDKDAGQKKLPFDVTVLLMIMSFQKFLN